MRLNIDISTETRSIQVEFFNKSFTLKNSTIEQKSVVTTPSTQLPTKVDEINLNHFMRQLNLRNYKNILRPPFYVVNTHVSELFQTEFLNLRWEKLQAPKHLVVGKSIICIPNIDRRSDHWSLIVINTIRHTTALYDSQQGVNSDNFDLINNWATFFNNYVKANFQIMTPPCPKQTDEVSSGIFVAFSAEYLERCAEPNFSNQNIQWLKQQFYKTMNDDIAFDDFVGTGGVIPFNLFNISSSCGCFKMLTHSDEFYLLHEKPTESDNYFADIQNLTLSESSNSEGLPLCEEKSLPCPFKNCTAVFSHKRSLNRHLGNCRYAQ